MKDWRVWLAIAVVAWIALNPEGIQNLIHNLGAAGNQALNTILPIVIVAIGVKLLWTRIK